MTITADVISLLGELSFFEQFVLFDTTLKQVLISLLGLGLGIITFFNDFSVFIEAFGTIFNV